MHDLASAAPAPDLAVIKSRQQATWASGDFGRIGVRLQSVGESLCEAVDLRATDRVLDVAAGNGNASLAAARHFADVTSTDYVPALLEQGRRRAEADGLAIAFQVADAESLPFDDARFDVVLSTFGVMFAPDPERAVPPAPGLRSPMEWGREPRLVELFGPRAADIRTRRRTYTFRYRSAEHWVEYFREFYGPTHRAFGALDEEGRRALRADLLDLLARFDRGGGAGLAVPGDYLEAVVSVG